MSMKQAQSNQQPAEQAKAMVLEVKDLCVSYGKVEAVHKVNLRIKEGEIVTVIGPNGAGKTTLMNALMAVLPSNGDIHYLGKAQRSDREVEEMVAQGMNLVPEKRELFSEMSVEDNLLLGAFDRYRRGKKDYAQTMEEVFQLFPRLKERRTQAAGTLSGGSGKCWPWGGL